MAGLRQFVLGIDGGGTKTLAILADFQGKVIAKASGGISNVQIAGAEAAAAEILKLVKECCSAAGCTPGQIRATVVGLAGAGRRPDQRRTLRAFRALAAKKGFRLRNIIVESDGRIAVEGALRGKPGIVIVAGTGSVGFAKDAEGNIHRVGGWGRAIGDEGSGFVVGREALRAISKHLDGRGEPTLLTALAGKTFRLSDPVKIVSRVYQDQFDVSALAPLVLRAAERGDRVARKILDRQSRELLDHVKVLVKKVRGPREDRGGKKIRIALLGGMLQYSNYLSRTLKKKIKSKFPETQIQTASESPAYGAVLMALERVKKTLRDLPPHP